MVESGKDIPLVEVASDQSREWMSRLNPLIGQRSTLLCWDERKNWDRSLLASQLFEVFGPHGIPEMFTAYSLPAVILFRRLRRPKVFTFGLRSKNLEAKFEELRTALS